MNATLTCSYPSLLSATRQLRSVREKLRPTRLGILPRVMAAPAPEFSQEEHVQELPSMNAYWQNLSHLGCHSSLELPGAQVECCGCYRLYGPAVIVKHANNALEAFLGQGARVELHQSSTKPAMTLTQAVMSQSMDVTSASESSTSMDLLSMDVMRSSTDYGYTPNSLMGSGPNGPVTITRGHLPQASPSCILMGSHMQVFGGFHIATTPRHADHDGRVRGVSEHDGAAVLSVHALERDEIRIVLHADGVLSHPLNVWPHART